ncbi:MAG: hypothetical protein AB7O24_18985 [Kofleriaceae bacterium]
MTSSRSRASTNRALGVALALATLIGLLVVGPGSAYAGRKRVVVLEFEGPAAAKFHKDVVKLIKKSHTVVPTDKWLSTADKLNVSGVTDKNVKKVAAKLKVDAVVQGRIEKRRNKYLIHLKLRSGKLGAVVGSQIDTKANGAKIDGKAAKEIRSELVEAIADISSAKPRGGDDEEDQEAAEEEDEPVAKGKAKKGRDESEEEAAEDEQEPVAKRKKGFARRDEEATAEEKVGGDEEPEQAAEEPEENQVASRDDDEEEEDEEETASVKKRGSKDGPADPLSPAERAVDLQVGASFTRRTLGWSVASDLMNKPPPYRGKIPVPGILIDATIYPLAIGHKRKGFLKNLGLTVMYDRVIKISSKDTATGMELASSESRYAVGAAFRQPLGASTVVGVMARYGAQSFAIAGNAGVPSVSYTIVDPTAFLRYSVSSNFVVGASVGYMLIMGIGTIGQGDQYGSGGASGVQGDLGVDYMLTKSLFLHGGFRFNTIALKFDGTGARTEAGGAAGQDVFGARDTYLGGAVTLGYAY